MYVRLSLTTHAINNPASARISVPSILIPQQSTLTPLTRANQGYAFRWRTPLKSTAPYWHCMFHCLVSLTVFRAWLMDTRDECSMVRVPIDALFVCPHWEAADPGWPGTPRHDARNWAYARQVPAQGNDGKGWGICGASRA